MARSTVKKPAYTPPAPPSHPPKEPTLGFFVAVTTYMGYAVLIVFGRLRDAVGSMLGCGRYYGGNKKPPKGYAPLCADWETFYTRRLYHRIQDCWNRPIASPPSANSLSVVVRSSTDGQATMSLDGDIKQCVNLGSYNYLGFGDRDSWNETCKADVTGALDRFHSSTGAPRMAGGTTSLHRQLEQTVAKFVGKPDAFVFNMGYGTNTSTVPGLIGKGGLIVSDALNHTSIVNGARASGAKIRVFKHDDMDSLENVLRNAIAEGQPRNHRPWKKILIMVEGIYSMEGDICNLPGIVKLAKRYKAYVYLDEAHSIGALGPTGRGACEYWGVDPADIDIMMGTFTKSFGAMGGYIAGSSELINYVRTQGEGATCTSAMSPIVCQQVLTAFRVVSGEDGTGIGAEKIAALRDNANYFRTRLEKMGFAVYGMKDSPVIPCLLINPTKIAAFSRECLTRGLAVVVVGFPATPLVTSRARFCLSAGHTREVLDEALAKIEEVGELLLLRYSKYAMG